MAYGNYAFVWIKLARSNSSSCAPCGDTTSVFASKRIFLSIRALSLRAGNLHCCPPNHGCWKQMPKHALHGPQHIKLCCSHFHSTNHFRHFQCFSLSVPYFSKIRLMLYFGQHIDPCNFRRNGGANCDPILPVNCVDHNPTSTASVYFFRLPPPTASHRFPCLGVLDALDI